MNSDNFRIVSVSARIVQVEVIDPNEFNDDFSLGSYLKIPYSTTSDSYAVGIITNYKIKDIDSSDPETAATPPSFILDLELIGNASTNGGEFRFIRGAHGIPLPPSNGIEILTPEELEKIFSTNLSVKTKFYFSKSSIHEEIRIPVDGNKFFNKHFAILGSTGSGKSNTVARIIQGATSDKDSDYEGLNNSHVFIFDIHDEYKQAFPSCNHIYVSNLVLPYWMLSGEELQELFLDTEANDHNQRNIFKEAIVNGKKEGLERATGETEHDFQIRKEKIHFDYPCYFDISSVYEYAHSKNTELIDTGEEYKTGAKKGQKKFTQGSLYGKLSNFVHRLGNKLSDRRLDFLIGEPSKTISFEETLRQFIGYDANNEANVTVLDLGGIPFEVLNITVSLISRILFDFGYYYKKTLPPDTSCEVPVLIIYEEAHKYAPRSGLQKYRASRQAIERIAKEGRKYGVTLGIVSQRPSEISETIFSQCNNFIAMRLTNPDDQNYVKRLLPDTLGNLTESLPTLQCGEAIIIGESIHLPTLVKIEECTNKPESSDIEFYELWKTPWNTIDFSKIIDRWQE